MANHGAFISDVFPGQKLRVVGLFLSLALAACSKSSPPAATGPLPAAIPPPTSLQPTEPTPDAGARAVKTEMRNVQFHLTDRAAAHLETVTGELWPTGKNEMILFDDKKSFEVHIVNGTVSITPQALGDIMNNYVFAKSDAPLKDISLAIKGNQLDIKGKLHSKGDIPFETLGTVSTNPDGRLRVHTEKVKALHVPVKKMMGMLGIDLANIVNTSKIDGMDTDKNDLLMDLGALLPPPHIRGKVVGVRLTSNAIVTTFGDGGKEAQAAEEGNYMRFTGSRVRFGKLIMESTDLTVLDLDPADPLDWDQDHYMKQLEAGYSKITASFGLRAYVRDFGKLKK
jgi:hypothetical protein